MGVHARRFGCLCLLALGVVGLSPASAGAGVTLGSPNLGGAGDFGLGCNDVSCVYVQKRLPGAEVRAPFSGEIRKWRVTSPGVYDYQLVVMRKGRKGKFKNVGVSSIGSAPAASTYEFPASLSIREGDYIGLLGEAVQGISNDQAKTVVFDPAVEFPDARKPTFSSADEYQFNATLRR
jgi:hypothetical protein